jgi:hypothetical protein
VVVLKGGRLEPAEWVAMPSVALTDGKPDGWQGQAFKISRFKNMTARSTWQSDPSVFDTASVYVFDDKANLLLVEDYPVDLPALPPSSDVEPERSDASSPEPAADPSAEGSAGSASPPAHGDGEAASAPAVAIPGSAPGGTPPSPAGEDPSLVDVKPPATRNDSRSRF